jgi:hypothetical protein
MASGNEGGKGLSLLFFLLLYAISLICAANFSDTRPIRTAETLGFTDPQIVSSTIWFTGFKGCGVSDSKVWYMEATRDGERVSFLVCGGLFRDNTVVVR